MGLDGAKRNDLQNRRLQVRFLSHLPARSLTQSGFEQIHAEAAFAYFGDSPLH
jgi:hypothetical protein